MGSNTTNYNWPYPALTDVPNVPSDLAGLATGIDTSVWNLLQGPDTSLFGGATRTAGQPVYVHADTAVVTVGVTNNYSVNFPSTFNGIRTLLVSPGDNAGALAIVTVAGGASNMAHFGGNCYAVNVGSTGSPPPVAGISNGTNIRINYIVVGW